MLIRPNLPSRFPSKSLNLYTLFWHRNYLVCFLDEDMCYAFNIMIVPWDYIWKEKNKEVSTNIRNHKLIKKIFCGPSKQSLYRDTQFWASKAYCFSVCFQPVLIKIQILWLDNCIIFVGLCLTIIKITWEY